MRPEERAQTAKRFLIAAGIGAVAAGVWAYFTKRQLEQQFGASAHELEQHFADRSSSLRREIESAAGRAGEQAARRVLDQYGITPGLISDLRTTLQLAAEIEQIAAHAGKSVDETATIVSQAAHRALGV